MEIAASKMRKELLGQSMGSLVDPQREVGNGKRD
jgi:hypothetical protein